MTNNTVPHDYRHRLRPHDQETDQPQALAVKPPQAKRQARRRTHTSRPYQERLLNMAEARREIVTALKIHRASSTRRQQQQSTYQHHREPPALQLQQQQQQQVQAVVAFQDRSQAAGDEEAYLAAHTTSTMSYAADSFANPLCINSPPAHCWIAAAGAGRYCSPPVLPCGLTPPELLPPPTAAAAAMGGLELEADAHYQGGLERLVHSLPARPLGLNLSFQGFGASVNDDGAGANKDDDCEDLLGLPSTQPSPSPAASYSYPYYSPLAVETTATTLAYGRGSPSPALSATDAENHSVSVIDAPAAAAALVPVLLGGGAEMTMAQASIGGETQGVEEWSEAAPADVAAWWSKIFASVESGRQQHAPGRPIAEHVAAAAPGLPAEWRWLFGDDAGVSEQQRPVTGGKPSLDVLGTMMHVEDGDGDGDGYYSCCYEGGRSDDGEDVALPCMDGIGEETEEGWGREWFSCS